MNKEEYTPATGVLYKGDKVNGMSLTPETIPCFLTTAFTSESLSDIKKVYETKGYTYVRTRNPNRTALAEVMSYLECGEASLIFSSGMGAITSTLIALLEPGDHIICNSNIYGETFSTISEILRKMSIETTFVDYNNMEEVKKSVKPNTKLIYSEVLSNPTLQIADLRGLAELAHSNGALLMVDNTFTTPVSIQPIRFGADIVVNSLTKFLNGHSDAIGGSITSTKEIVDKIHTVSMLCGTPGDPFDSWLILRGIHTAEIRLPQQMKTAEKLAAALEKNKHVSLVNHPSLASYKQKALADSMFGEKGRCAMLSFIVPEDIDKIDAFMKKLKFASYAPTLGGIRTTMSHPVTSSHMTVPDDIRRKMGITPGMIRISVGIEDADDLIKDFEQALTVFDE